MGLGEQMLEHKNIGLFKSVQTAEYRGNKNSNIATFSVLVHELPCPVPVFIMILETWCHSIQLMRCDVIKIKQIGISFNMLGKLG